MTFLSPESLAVYWSPITVEANIIVFLNLLGALLLGLLVGYERSYHGRAAGMRTYGLVCLASAALTVIVGYPELWFGGHGGTSNPDVTRVIQGIVTGVGFLCAGVIIKEGFTISGLTTAASIWAASVIGVLVGIGFYFASIMMAILSAGVMMWISKLEGWLPTRHAIAATLTFRQDFEPREESVKIVMRERGYSIANGTMMISSNNDRQEWRFVAIALRMDTVGSIAAISHELHRVEGLESFQLSFARN